MPATSGSTSGSPPTNNDGNKRSGKKRVRAFTAEERASHRVIEKQRREALNEEFLDLARLIPALAPARRLSKSAIVHEGVKHLQAQREMCIAAASDIQAILNKNLELTAEVNQWREQYGSRNSSCQIIPVTDAVSALLRIEQEILGTFPGGFGDNANGDEHDEFHRAEPGLRPQQQRRTSSGISHPHPHALQPSMVNASRNVPDIPSIHDLRLSNELARTTGPLLSGLPNTMVMVDHSVAQHILPEDELFHFLSGGYGLPLVPNVNMNFANDFEVPAIQGISYQDFDIPPSATDFYLATHMPDSDFPH